MIGEEEEKKEDPLKDYDEEKEKRMDIIAQNGNDGEHYDEARGTTPPEKDWKVRLYNWIKKNAPETLVYGKNMDISRPEKEEK